MFFVVIVAVVILALMASSKGGGNSGSGIGRGGGVPRGTSVGACAGERRRLARVAGRHGGGAAGRAHRDAAGRADSHGRWHLAWRWDPAGVVRGAPVYHGHGRGPHVGVGVIVPLGGPVHTHDGNVDYDDPMFAGDELYVSMTLVSTYDGRVLWHARDHVDREADHPEHIERIDAARSSTRCPPPSPARVSSGRSTCAALAAFGLLTVIAGCEAGLGFGDTGGSGGGGGGTGGGGSAAGGQGARRIR